MWLENVDVDLDYHLRRARVAAPGGRRELDELIGRIASTPLDRSRPLWEFHFVEGIADDRFAIVCKVHHTLADGVASANLLSLAMDPMLASDDDTYPTDPPPSTWALLRAAGRDHLEQIGRFPEPVTHTVKGISRVRRRARERVRHPAMARNFHPPNTFINHVVSAERTFATATLALADVKETKNLLGECASRICRRRSRRRISTSWVPHCLADGWPTCHPAIAPWAFRRIARTNARNALYNVPVSNVPGPRERGRISGAPISELYSVGPVMAGCGMNITVWSYVDQLNISVISDDLTVGDPHEVTDAMGRALVQIRSAAGLSPTLTDVDTAMAPAIARG